MKKNGITNNFLTPRKPQQNGVVERKIRNLEEMASTMFIEIGLAKHYWAEAVTTANNALNRCLIRPILKITPNELFKEANLIYRILDHLNASVLLMTMEKKILVNLMLKVMKVSS